MNLVMDVSRMMPEGYHFFRPHSAPNNITRLAPFVNRCRVTPMRYYFIDFEYSVHYRYGRESARTFEVVGGRRLNKVPELASPGPYNPFKIDVYNLGEAFLDIFKARLSLYRHLVTSTPNYHPTRTMLVWMISNHFFIA